MTTETYPDIEGGLRTWLRTQTPVTAIVGQRVFFGIPKGATEATFPLVALFRVGGGDAEGDAAVDIAVVQFDCYGGIDASGNGKKAEAWSVVNGLRTSFNTVRGRTQLASGIYAFGINVESVIWLPDPDNDRPRYAVTAEVVGINS